MTDHTSNASQPTPERDETDSSLRIEREKTDVELRRRRTVLEQKADQAIERARESADDLIKEERLGQDTTLTRTESSAATEQLASARASADTRVTKERAFADEKLSKERISEEQAIKLLLALEREETDQRLRMERLRSDRAVASRDDFLGMVSHDVRDNLGAIAMSAELLLRILPVSDQAAHLAASRICRLTARMSRLIKDLLDVVCLESGTLSMDTKTQDASPLLLEAADSLRPAVTASGIELTTEIAAGLAAANFDHDRILQVLTNLVGNAMKFTKRGGKIELLAAPTPTGIQFTVRDTGCGIPHDMLESVFERFSQAHGGDGRGLGLGLYISRCIVEAHGGKIWAESEVGKGSSFHFTL